MGEASCYECQEAWPAWCCLQCGIGVTCQVGLGIAMWSISNQKQRGGKAGKQTRVGSQKGQLDKGENLYAKSDVLQARVNVLAHVSVADWAYHGDGDIVRERLVKEDIHHNCQELRLRLTLTLRLRFRQRRHPSQLPRAQAKVKVKFEACRDRRPPQLPPALHPTISHCQSFPPWRVEDRCACVCMHVAGMRAVLV